MSDDPHPAVARGEENAAMSELKDLRAKVQAALRAVGEPDDGLLDRYDAVRAREVGKRMRQQTARGNLILPEFEQAWEAGLHQGADLADPEGAE